MGGRGIGKKTFRYNHGKKRAARGGGGYGYSNSGFTERQINTFEKIFYTILAAAIFFVSLLFTVVFISEYSVQVENKSGGAILILYIISVGIGCLAYRAHSKFKS